MNKNKKNQAAEKKHKITFIDIGVWLVCACILVVGALTVLPSFSDWKEQPEETDSEKTVIYTVELKGLTPSQAELINIGAEVNLVIGDQKADSKCSIVKFEQTAGSKWELSPDGESMAFTEDISSINIFVTFELNCIYQEGLGYFFDEIQLLVGEQSILNFESIDISGECVAITVKE